jgi:hypothetical protein
MSEKLASTGAAIDAALDEDTNAMRDAAKQRSDANFAAEQQARDKDLNQSSA